MAAKDLDKKDMEYDEVLLERNNYPANRGEISNVEPIKLKNASCGDELDIYLKVVDGKIADGKYTGAGCAISMASADLFIDSVRGKTIEEAKELSEVFGRMIIGEASEKEEKELGVAEAMKCVSRMPARANCAKLAWKSLEFYKN